jgi:hypothetical protein
VSYSFPLDNGRGGKPVTQHCPTCESNARKAARLEAALKKYGYHRLDCARFVPGSSGVCDCGWAEARAALKGEEKSDG